MLFRSDCELNIEHNHAAFLREGDPLARGGNAPAPGFYCKHCGTMLGATLPSNNHNCRHCDNTGRVTQRVAR